MCGTCCWERVNIDLVDYGVCSEENGFLTSFKLLVKGFKVSWKAMLHRVCPLALGVSGEVIMDSTNFPVF